MEPQGGETRTETSEQRRLRDVISGLSDGGSERGDTWGVVGETGASQGWKMLLHGGTLLCAFAFGILGMKLAFADGKVSPIWPLSGFALMVVYRGGWSFLPSLWGGTVLASVIIGGVMPPLAIVFAVGNAVETVVAVFVLRHWRVDPGRPVSVSGLLILLCTSMIAPFFSAFIATVALRGMTQIPAGAELEVFGTWWAGNCVGILLMAPCMAVIHDLACGRQEIPSAKIPEFFLLLGISLLMTMLLFVGMLPLSRVDPVLVYVLFPLFIWASLRFGVVGAASIVAAVMGVAVVLTVHGYGAFVRESQIVSLVLLDSFMAIAGMTSLLLAVVLEQRDQEAKRSRLLAQAVEQSATSVIVTNRKGDIIYTNQAFTALTGYEQNEALGRNPRFLNGGYLQKDLYRQMWRAILSGETWRGEFLNVCKSQSLSWEQATISPVRDDSGRIVAFVCTAEDVTERKKSDENLRSALVATERSKGELERIAYAVTHTLQEPLRTISGFAQLLVRRYTFVLDETALGYLERVVRGTEKMHHLFQDLMHYVLIEEGTIAQPIVLESVAHAAVRACGGEQWVRILPLPVVLGNERQLLHVFEHLLANCLKFAHPLRSPNVVISATREPPTRDASGMFVHGSGSDVLRAHSGEGIGCERWVISVADNGIGIEPEFFPRLFTLFSRLHASEEYDGTGVGLAYCRRVIEHHGGRVWVESDGKEGTRVLFSLWGQEAATGGTVSGEEGPLGT